MNTMIKTHWPYLLGGLLLSLYLTLGVYLITTMREPQKEGPARTIRLTLAVPAGIKTAAIYRDHIRKFEEANPDISVKLLEVGGKFYQKVLVMIAGNVAPDLMWMGQSFSEFNDRQAFLDITDRIQNAGIDLNQYEEKILKLYMKDGRHYSLPFGIDVSFIAYNRKLFREAGLPYPRDEWTYEEFLHAANTLTVRDEQGRVIRYGCRSGLSKQVFGASMFDPATGAVACNTPEMIEYFTTNLALRDEHRVIPNPEEAAGLSDTLSVFKQGRVAMTLLHTMRWNRAFDMLADMDWGMTLSPKVNRHAQWASSQAICIYRKTRYPDAAWKLFMSFQDKDFQRAMSCRMIPALKSVAAETARQTENRPANFKVIAKIVKILTPTPRVPHLQELEAVFGRYSGQIFTNRLSPAEGMKQCADEMNRRIEKFNKQ
jgi:multiple sugar transport system substrate-binding protein